MQDKNRRAMFVKLTRAKKWEDESYYKTGHGVKYGFESKDGYVATLVADNKFKDEMSMRITNRNNFGDRFEVRGHKSIMNKWTPDETKRHAERDIETHKQLE